MVHGGQSLTLDGGGSPWSPEHTLLSSLGLGMLTTFEKFAGGNGIEILACDAKIGGTVEQTPEGLTFTSIILELELSIAGNVDLVEDTLEHAKRYCVVLNSLRVPVVVETQLRTPGEMANEMPAEMRRPTPRGTLDRHHAS